MDPFPDRRTDPLEGPGPYVPPPSAGSYVPPAYEREAPAATYEPATYEAVPAYAPPRAAWATFTDKSDFVKWAFYAGLASGVLILLCAFSVALLMTVMGFLGGPTFAWPWVTDPDGPGPRVSDPDWSPAVPFLFALWGLITGGAVLLGALRLKENHEAAAGPGAIMLLGGLLSFLVFGGFLVGGILAIVAGVLAVAGARSVFALRGPRVRGHERPPSV